LWKASSFTLLVVASTTIVVGCVIVPGLDAVVAHLGVVYGAALALCAAMTLSCRAPPAR
jgi:hypothetical protein